MSKCLEESAIYVFTVFRRLAPENGLKIQDTLLSTEKSKLIGRSLCIHFGRIWTIHVSWEERKKNQDIVRREVYAVEPR